MDRYELKGKLYLTPRSRPIDFSGSFVRKKFGLLEGNMVFDSAQGVDERDTIYGSLINEDALDISPKERAGEDVLVLFHTKGQEPIDRVYWLSRVPPQKGSFEGKYQGLREACQMPFEIEEIRDAFGWNVPDCLKELRGSEVELVLTKQRTPFQPKD
jgi:hypothetical protein